MPEIISRKEAAARGLKRYFSGKPCPHGHLAERFVSHGCVECNLRKIAAHGPQRRARQRDRMSKMNDLVAVLRKEMPELLKEFGL